MGRKKKILIIDKNKSHLEILQEKIGSDYQLKSCRELKEAHQKLKKEKFDLIFSEYYRETNDDWIQEIKNKASGSPFIILSSQSDQKKAIQSMKMGADDYLFKNKETLSHLSEQIEKVIHKKEKRNPLPCPPKVLENFGKKLKDMSDFIQDPGKGWEAGKEKMAQFEKEFENLKSNLKNLFP